MPPPSRVRVRWGQRGCSVPAAPLSCAHSGLTADPQRWKSLSRAGGTPRELPCSSPCPGCFSGLCGAAPASLAGSQHPTAVAMRARSSFTPSGLSPRGGCDRDLGGPQHPWRLQGQSGLRSGGLSQARRQWHCWGHRWDIAAAAVGQEGFSLRAWRVPGAGTAPLRGQEPKFCLLASRLERCRGAASFLGCGSRSSLRGRKMGLA